MQKLTSTLFTSLVVAILTSSVPIYLTSGVAQAVSDFVVKSATSSIEARSCVLSKHEYSPKSASIPGTRYAKPRVISTTDWTWYLPDSQLSFKRAIRHICMDASAS